jgi:hypothetical protein
MASTGSASALARAATSKRSGSIEDSPETLREIENWAIDGLLRFKSVVGPRVEALVATGAAPTSFHDYLDTD